jgi:glutamine synthetase
MTDHDRIRVLWPDHLGLARGKYLPARLAEHGTNHCTAVFALGYDRSMVPAPGSGMLEGFPDLHASFDVADVRDGWEERTKVVVADITKDGEEMAISPRRALKRAIADWEGLGYRPQVGIELETFLFQADGKGGWEPLDTPGGYVYGTGICVDPLGVIDDVMRAADASGLPVESINSEYDIPQFELTLQYRDALAAVDDAFLFKVLTREVAHRHGLLATFMGKPLGDRGGNGTHINLSLMDGSRNGFADENADDGLSTLARQCIAGLLAHHEGMTALCAPTVNAYKRLRPAQLSGYWANWGYDHRCACVRVPTARGDGTRLEHRMADGAANPYTVTASVLQAARLGVVNELEPPPAETGDGLDEVNTEVCCPPSLSAALDALEADTEFVEAIGAEMVAQFTAVKRAEWERFAGTVTDWELNEYLPFH